MLDEVGDFVCSFEKLFEVVGGYIDYLCMFVFKLLYEFNMLLVIVKFLLDNLEYVFDVEGGVLVGVVLYFDCVCDGIVCFGMLVCVMSEVSCMECVIVVVELEDVDLCDVVCGCVDFYCVLVGM